MDILPKINTTPEVVREVVIVVTLIAAAVGLAAMGHGELASMALGGAMGRAGGNAIGGRASGSTPAAAALMVAIAMGLSGLSGCAGLSTAQRLSYAEESARCVLNEREIKARPGTTFDQDLADLTSERMRCAEALRQVEEGE